MAEMKENKKRLSISLSFFASNDPIIINNCNSSTKPTTKSPRSFEEPNGVVGLGIVAAMNDLDQTHDPYFSSKSSRAAILAISPRSNPIPIFSRTLGSSSSKFDGAAAKLGGPGSEEVEDMELSEEYTCVISHIGNNLIKKSEYFDGESSNKSESTTSYWVSSEVFSASSPSRDSDLAVFRTADFLNSCYLCKKKLHGLDIFMYRGEKAFCSSECRYQQISTDEHKEKCGSGLMNPIEYSTSPCSGQMQFFAGVAAA